MKMTRTTRSDDVPCQQRVPLWPDKEKEIAVPMALGITTKETAR